MVNLSKSHYTSFCQCPKNLWLSVRPQVSGISPDDVKNSLEARLEKGKEVGELAKQLFPGTVDVSVKKANGNPDIGTMLANTQQCLKDGTKVIAEAAFLHDGCYCAVDLLRREGDGWAIYEVKSTTDKDDKGKQKKFDKYLPDIAFQTWVLRQCGITVTGINLVCLNRDYVRQGKLDIQQLFSIIDVCSDVQNELAKVPTLTPNAQQILVQQQEPIVDLSEHCNKPYPCVFWEYCTRHLPKPSVFDVYGSSTGKGDLTFHFDKKLEHYHAGRVSYKDLIGQPLGIVQRMQVERKTHIDRNGIRKFLDGLSYPLYFLDFETMQSAVAEFEGVKPYQQIPFQYSLHIAKRPGKYDHLEYLAESDGTDPRRGVAEQLCDDIPANVCVLAYNMPFEKNCLKDLAYTFPDLSRHLMLIHDNMVDLLVPFREGYYYVPAMGGSFSIKSVLPALFPNDPKLDYRNLKDVHNGSEAMDIFPKIRTMSRREAARTHESLLRYCELDTWAMVKIWEKLIEVAR